jgi:hypothetical protein
MRPHDQYGRHDQKLGDKCQFRNVERNACKAQGADADAQRLDLGDQHRGRISARNRSHPAQNHDDERVADDVEVHHQVGRLARNLKGAGESGKQRPNAENRGEQHRLVDAKGSQHLAVFGGGAHQPSETGAGDDDLNDHEHEGANADQKQVVGRQMAPEDFDGSTKTRGTGAQEILGAPQPQRGVAEDEDEREGGEQLKQLGRTINSPQQHPLDQRPEQPHQDRGSDHAAPETDRPSGLVGHGRGQIGAKHVERAMRHVDDAGDTKNERQAGGHQE